MPFNSRKEGLNVEDDVAERERERDASACIRRHQAFALDPVT